MILSMGMTRKIDWIVQTFVLLIIKSVLNHNQKDPSEENEFVLKSFYFHLTLFNI